MNNNFFEQSAAKGADYLDKKVSEINKTGVTGVTDVTTLINRDNSGNTTENSGVTGVTDQLPDGKEVPCFRVYDRHLKQERIIHGVWYFEKDKEGNVNRTRVCSPLHIKAVTYDRQENNYGRLLHFKTTIGNWRTWAMPMDMLRGSGDELRGELFAMGVEIQPGSKAKNLLPVYLQSNPPKKQISCALQVGWCQDAFLLPDKVYGADADEIIFQSGNRCHEEYIQKGTLEGWQAGIASYAVANPMLMIGLSAAFTGALLKKTNAESGGIHFVGESSTGKSTCGIAASSVWGGENYRRSWRATANGLEGAAMLFNDGLLVLDEIGECDAREVGNIVYALGNGKGKQRANRSGGAREVNSWRCFVLSNGEVTISTKMNEANQRSKAGQAVRLLDLPVGRKHGIFDELYGFDSGADLSDSIKKESDINFGVAGRAYLENLTNDTKDFNERFRYIKESGIFKTEGAQGQHKRVAARFALIALAGELATEYGVTGWNEGDALCAAIEGFRVWCKTRGQGNDEKRQILEQLADFIDRYSDSRFSSVNNTNAIIHDRSGWYEDSSNGRLYLFTSGGLREALKGHDFKRCLDMLVSVGALPEPDEDNKRSAQRKINGKNTRVYEINVNKVSEVAQ
jgi:putative DNA primase/helicase